MVICVCPVDVSHRWIYYRNRNYWQVAKYKKNYVSMYVWFIEKRRKEKYNMSSNQIEGEVASMVLFQKRIFPFFSHNIPLYKTHNIKSHVDCLYTPRPVVLILLSLLI